MHADPDRPVDPQTLVAMAAIQHHRGPDGFGWQVMDGRGVGFSHARLSIIDLDEDRGRQPFRSADGGLLLAQNGELYDYKRLRADLVSRGARFRTKSDSELVLHLYPRLGLEDMLPQLRGEFAFALYDRGRDRLMLVRDRFGIKPLYWAEVGGSFVFGSELKVLFAHPEVPREFSSQGLYHQLMQTMVPGSTAFAGIHQVKPGHVVIVERAHGRFRIREQKYWDMDFPLQNEREDGRSESHYIEGVREHLLQAVQLRLEADVPVACYLSGGIDSCSILGLSSASQQSPVKAFTIGFDDKDYDETPIARDGAVGGCRSGHHAPAGRPSLRQLRRDAVAHGAHHLQHPGRRQAAHEPACEERRLQGGGDRRGFRRAVRRLSGLPPRHVPARSGHPAGKRASGLGAAARREQ
jgi:asparagine synthase (glutamine-hydrolysing)